MVGAGFISFTILNAILSRGASLTIVEVAPRILPRMVDAACAEIVAGWLHEPRRDAQGRGDADARSRSRGASASSPSRQGDPIIADVVIMATGIRTNLEWLEGSGIETERRAGQGGIVVDDHLRSSVKNVYAGGRRGARTRISSRATLEVHAIEPTAQEHGRVVGANMAGRDVAYRGSLIMNIVEVCHLDVASFGQWDDASAEVYTAMRPERSQYRKLLFHGGRLTGAMICGPADDIWTTNDVGMLKGLVYVRRRTCPRWKAHLARESLRRQAGLHRHAHDGARCCPQTILGRPSHSPELPQSVMVR